MAYHKEPLPMSALIQESYIAVKALLFFSCLLGLVYPLAITIVAQFALPESSSGSLIKRDGKVVGSKLIGQAFASEHYFHSRPSAHHYNGMASGASNLGPSSKKLRRVTLERILLSRIINQIPPFMSLPADMVLTSASGLDPHISIENALLQLPRIAQIRNLDETTLKTLIVQNLEQPLMGMWGQARVNVLLLNLALDKVTQQQPTNTVQPSTPW